MGMAAQYVETAFNALTSAGVDYPQVWYGVYYYCTCLICVVTLHMICLQPSRAAKAAAIPLSPEQRSVNRSMRYRALVNDKAEYKEYLHRQPHDLLDSLNPSLKLTIT
ncbi:hypothetical protein KIPB_002106 [Kipferlia bialata]|uniref:Uncharacterized protein n=1 Tax=Kipferlia bialata TaxID=797122 RepID=A0A391NJ59_9EUKA|nr:hypothetical protein KIPB_002106 [Kipferlia bialata]|eukprot:g2106.t1